MGYLTDTPSGRLKTTMVERVEQMEVPLAHIIPEMTSNLLVPIAIIIYLFVLDWRMALVSLITIPIGMLCYMAQMKEYPKKYGAVVQASKYMSATTVEYINGIEVIKAFNQSAASYGKFTQAVRQSVDLMLDWMKSTPGLFCSDDDDLAGCIDWCITRWMLVLYERLFVCSGLYYHCHSVSWHYGAAGCSYFFDG